MANRDYKLIRFLERGIVGLVMDVTIGGVGAPTLTPLQNLGVTSITRTGAGVYSVVLSDNYTRLVYFNIIQVGASQDLTFQVTTDLNAAGNTFVFTCKTANAATDPTNGTALNCVLLLKNSSVP